MIHCGRPSRRPGNAPCPVVVCDKCVYEFCGMLRRAPRRWRGGAMGTSRPTATGHGRCARPRDRTTGHGRRKWPGVMRCEFFVCNGGRARCPHRAASPRGRADFAWVMRHGRWRGAGCEIFNTKEHKALLRGLYRITKFFEFLWARFENHKITRAAVVNARSGSPAFVFPSFHRIGL